LQSITLLFYYINTGKSFLKTTFSKKWISTLLPTFWTVSKIIFAVVETFLEKVIKSEKKRVSYPPFLRNSLESWQKSKYALCKIITLQKKIACTVCPTKSLPLEWTLVSHAVYNVVHKVLYPSFLIPMLYLYSFFIYFCPSLYFFPHFCHVLQINPCSRRYLFKVWNVYFFAIISLFGAF